MMLGNPVQELEANRRWLAVADEHAVNVEVDIHSLVRFLPRANDTHSTRIAANTAKQGLQSE
jgi:hypothetical protein